MDSMLVTTGRRRPWVPAILLALAAAAAGCGADDRPAGNVVPPLDYAAPAPRGTPPSPSEIRAAGGNGALMAGDTDLFAVRSAAAARRLAGRTAHGTQLVVERLVGDTGFVIRRSGAGRIYVQRPPAGRGDHEQEELLAGDVVALSAKVRRAASAPPLGGATLREVRRRGLWLAAERVEPVV